MEAIQEAIIKLDAEARRTTDIADKNQILKIIETLIEMRDDLI